MGTLTGLPITWFKIEHGNWHMQPGHMPSDPGFGVAFLTFHCNLVGDFWRIFGSSQPPAVVQQLTPWQRLPDELRVTISADAVSRCCPSDNLALDRWDGFAPDDAFDIQARFLADPLSLGQTDEQVGQVLGSGPFHGFVHYAVTQVYCDPNMAPFDQAPASTYFWQFHGMIQNWWQTWKVAREHPDPACAGLRQQLAHLHQQIQRLEQQKAGLNIRDPRDRAEYIEILRELRVLGAQVASVQQQMQQHGCPAPLGSCQPLVT